MKNLRQKMYRLSLLFGFLLIAACNAEGASSGPEALVASVNGRLEGGQPDCETYVTADGIGPLPEGVELELVYGKIQSDQVGGNTAANMGVQEGEGPMTIEDTPWKKDYGKEFESEDCILPTLIRVKGYGVYEIDNGEYLTRAMYGIEGKK